MLHDILVPELPLIEKIIRPIIVYFFLLLLIRFGGKRELGSMTAFDIIVLLVLGNAVQNAIIGEDYSLSGGLIDATVLMFCNYIMVRFSYRSARVQRLVEGTPTLLVRNGKMVVKNLAKEAITEDELRAKLCQRGFEELAEVRLAILETDGTLSVERTRPVKEEQKELSDRLTKIEVLLSELKS